MWESKHKCSALESNVLLAASFWKVLVIWGESSAIYTTTLQELSEGSFYSVQLRTRACIFWVIRPLKISLDKSNKWYVPLLSSFEWKRPGLKLPQLPTDASRTPNPSVLSILQFVPVYVTVNQFCYIDTAPLKPWFICLVLFPYQLKINPCKLLHSFQIKIWSNLIKLMSK